MWQSLRSLWHYHHDVYSFHTGKFLDERHARLPVQPQGWLILNRPVGVEADLGIKPGVAGLHAPAGSTCLRQVLLLGTPALWWGGALALALRGRTAGSASATGASASPWSACSCWLPWIPNDDRPIFSYYAIAIIPFTDPRRSLLCLGAIIGPAARVVPAAPAWGRSSRGAYVVAGDRATSPGSGRSATDQLITTPHWLQRIWFHRWI